MSHDDTSTTRIGKTSERQQTYIDIAMKLAQKSVMEHKHGAVIVISNEVIAMGFNHKQEFMCHQRSIHAEVDAILKVKGRNKCLLNDAEMYVVRIGTVRMNFPLKYSKPCCECQKVIMKYGIRKVYYSVNDELQLQR
jgi:deoxycytidylate deaminase